MITDGFIKSRQSPQKFNTANVTKALYPSGPHTGSEDETAAYSMRIGGGGGYSITSAITNQIKNNNGNLLHSHLADLPLLKKEQAPSIKSNLSSGRLSIPLLKKYAFERANRSVVA